MFSESRGGRPLLGHFLGLALRPLLRDFLDHVDERVHIDLRMEFPVLGDKLGEAHNVLLQGINGQASAGRPFRHYGAAGRAVAVFADIVPYDVEQGDQVPRDLGHEPVFKPSAAANLKAMIPSGPRMREAILYTRPSML